MADVQNLCGNLSIKGQHGCETSYGRINHLYPEIWKMLARRLYDDENSMLHSGSWYTCNRNLNPVSETDNFIY